MSEVSSAYSSSSRITGLYSELDTDSIVEDLLAVEQTKIDDKKKSQDTYEWYIDAVESVQKAVETFQDTYLSALGSSSMLTAATYKSFDVTSNSDSNAVTITAGTGASAGNMTIDSVTQLAVNASVSSASSISADGTEISSSNTATLAKLSFATELEFDSDDEISFSINGVGFSFDSDTTLQSMINTINADSTANVTMKYSRLTDTFTITADEGGKDSSVVIENLSGNAFGENSAFGIGEGTTANGKNAILSIEGVALEKDSNKFTIDGITYNLNQTTEEEISFTVTQDVSATVEAIETFVDAYNELVDTISSLLSEDDYSADYEPLTDAEKEEMSDDEIEAWEEKAKIGLLRNNSDLESLLDSLQNAFFSQVGGSGATMASLGITTGGYFSSDKGKIVVDTDALTEALEGNSELVAEMFTNASDSNGETGLLYIMRNAINTYSGNAEEDIENTEDKVDVLDTKIEDMEDKLDDLAERYYNKFAVMEEALSRLNATSNMISTLMGS